jgi:hypothetical protein
MDTSVLGEGSAAVAASSTTLDIIAAVGSLGIAGLLGAIGGAIYTNWATRNREHSSWLRQLQINANRDFYEGAHKLLRYAFTDYADRPLTPADAPPDTPDEVLRIATELNLKLLTMRQVCERGTYEMAGGALQLLVRFAYQAIPLPKANSLAALELRKQALDAMSEILFDLAIVMRNDIGLADEADRQEANSRRSLSRYEPLTRAVIDRPVQREPDDPPGHGINEVLGHWLVRPIEGDAVPKSITEYVVDELPITRADGTPAQACAIKLPNEYWRFGMLDGLPVPVAMSIYADVTRLITGHINAFRTRYADSQWVRYQNGRAFIWADLHINMDDPAAKSQPVVNFVWTKHGPRLADKRQTIAEPRESAGASDTPAEPEPTNS